MVDKLKGNIFFRRTKIPVSEKTIEILKKELEYTLDDIELEEVDMKIPR